MSYVSFDKTLIWRFIFLYFTYCMCVHAESCSTWACHWNRTRSEDNLLELVHFFHLCILGTELNQVWQQKPVVVEPSYPPYCERQTHCKQNKPQHLPLRITVVECIILSLVISIFCGLKMFSADSKMVTATDICIKGDWDHHESSTE